MALIVYLYISKLTAMKERTNKLRLSWDKLSQIFASWTRSSSCEIVLPYSCLPMRLSSYKVVFLWCPLPMRSSSYEVVFLWGRLPNRSFSMRSSSYDILVWPGMVWAWFGMHIDLKYQVSVLSRVGGWGWLGFWGWGKPKIKANSVQQSWSWVWASQKCHPWFG